jgi:3-phosphoshikimate 1-carboxyvinyltransferase
MRARVHPLRGKLSARAPLTVPGDKSISHRALLFAALAEGESRIGGLAPGADVRSTARCLFQLGVPLVRGDGTPWSSNDSVTSAGVSLAQLRDSVARPAGSLPLPAVEPGMGRDDAIVRGVGLHGLRAPGGPLDCGNSGTTMRLLTGVLAGAGIEATLIGDASLSRRPMERVAAPLRQLGARIDTGEKGRPPVVVHAGAPLHAESISLDVASAQVKSALLLAGLFVNGDTHITEPARSRDHTERMLRQMGAKLTVRGASAAISGPAQLSPLSLEVPGDLSSAAFLLAAALVAPEGSALALVNVGVNPTRAGFLDAAALFGARLSLTLHGGQERGFNAQGEPAARIEAQGQPLRGAVIDGELTLRAIDEVPILAVLGALAEGETVIRGAAELRVKESDRLQQMASGLRTMGASVEELPDGLRIQGNGARGLRGGVQLDSAHDHRIALAFAVAALRADAPVTISGAEWADVSFPGFFALLRTLGAEVELFP